MPKSLADQSVRNEMLDRLERLSPDATPRWGRMSSAQMLAHLADWMAMAEGSLAVAPIRMIVRYSPLKQLAIYWLPFPKNVMTARELRTRKARDWSIELETVRQRLEGFEGVARRVGWPHHPAFGKMTRRAWCVFAYRHMDHHFRQFGI